MALDAKKVLDAYLDMKSPHAYLAVRPSLEAALDYRVQVNFLPYTMSYTGFGLTASVEANRKARMYYTAACQYAVRPELPFRLLDSASANKTFLFAKRQGLEVHFLIHVYVQGWGASWRDYEIESLERLRNTLAEVGARTDGFEEFMAPNGAREAELESCMAKAGAAGFTGVPRYVFGAAKLDAKLLMEPRDQFYGERSGTVSDPFGHRWNIGHHIEEVSTDEMQRRYTEILKGTSRSVCCACEYYGAPSSMCVAPPGEMQAS